MCSRLIIEQRLADLELALTRQEELVVSQREAIRGLRELIELEYSGGWKNAPSSSKPLTVSATQDGNINLTRPPVGGSTNKRSQVDVSSSSSSSSITTTTCQPSTKDAPAGNSSSESAKKRPKCSSSSVSGSDGDFMLRPEKSSFTNTATTPGIVRNPQPSSSSSGIAPSPSLGVPGSSAKKRRALEKVRQFLTLLPPFGEPRSVKPSPSKTPNSVLAAGGNDTFQPIVKGSVEIGQITTAIAPTAPVPIKSPPPRKSKKINADIAEAFARLPVITSYEDRLEMLKELNVFLKLHMSDVKKALEDSGGREYIAQWLRDLNFDEKPPKSISTFLDYSLKLIDQVSWTVDLVVESRIDKIVRKIYKRFSPFKDIISDDLSQFIREQWYKYRLMYRQAGLDEDE